jgi:hypothetical protein
MHPIDQARSRLLRAGYALGEACFGARWIVELSKGGHLHQIPATGHEVPSPAEGFDRATSFPKQRPPHPEYGDEGKRAVGGLLWKPVARQRDRDVVFAAVLQGRC